MLPSSVTSAIGAVTGTGSSSSSGVSVTDTIAGAQQASTNAQAGAKSVMSYMPYAIGGLVLLLIVILVPLYFLGYLTKKKANTSTVAALGGAVSSFQSGPSTEGFQGGPPPSDTASDLTFINAQPLSIKDTGFEGPYPSGVFDPASATAGALKAGFRFLTLQIDFMDSDKDATKFEKPKVPTLLVRSASGSLLSSNSGSITEVAQAIANIGFNPTIPNSTKPIILYLHINRTPASPLSDPNGYLSFLSQIATALAPLTPYHLGLTPLGNFTRQKVEGVLLTTPLSSLDGQVVILSNADTSLFRKESSSIQKYDPANDLDFWVNMRVYLDSDEDSFGITELADDRNPPFAVLVNLDRILALSPAKQAAFAKKSSSRYVIAMPHRTDNPAPEVLNVAINTLGVNVVPVDIFTDTTEDILAITGKYSNKSYNMKPLALRNIV